MENPFKLLSDQLFRIENRLEAIDSKLNGLSGANNKDETTSREEAAKYIGVSVRTIDTFVKTGQLVAIRLGSRVRFDYKDLDAFIKKKKR